MYTAFQGKLALRLTVQIGTLFWRTLEQFLSKFKIGLSIVAAFQEKFVLQIRLHEVPNIMLYCVSMCVCVHASLYVKNRPAEVEN